MAKNRTISEIVGRADFAGQKSGMVYRALRPIRCATCDQLIAEGELFTRRTVAGEGLRILPKCQQCAPFTLRPEGKGTGHPMLDSLLSRAAETSHLPEKPLEEKPSSGSSPDREKRQRIAEAVRDRLGPALQHSRKKATFIRKRG